jgi:hypothetical protein
LENDRAAVFLALDKTKPLSASGLQKAYMIEAFQKPSKFQNGDQVIGLYGITRSESQEDEESRQGVLKTRA